MTDKRKRVLLVDDEADMTFILSEAFRNAGYETKIARNGRDGITAYYDFQPDIVISDITMPDGNGLPMVKEIRNKDPRIPIFLLTGKVSVSDAIDGFEYLINDYIRKPFSCAEVVARASAAIKLSRVNSTQNINIGLYRFKFTSRELTYPDGHSEILTGREASVLQVLGLNINRMVAFQSFYSQAKIWSDKDFFATRSLQVFISKIRKMLSDDPNLEIINEKGIGYILVDSTPAE